MRLGRMRYVSCFVKRIFSPSAGMLSFLTAGVMLLFCLQGCGAPHDRDPGDKTWRAVFVIDGDTIELAGGARVRYIGIDTPETRRRFGGEWVYDPEPYGPEATNRNIELVMGEPLRLEFDREKKDRYGRTLAYVFADDVMVNDLLIKEGLATVYTFPPNTRYYPEFVSSQREAIAGGRGIWSDLKSIGASDAAQYHGKFCRVKGKVSGHRLSRGRIYLYMHSEGPEYLRLVIFSRNLPLFREQGIDPIEYYEGSFVEAIGKVDQGGTYAEMMIDNPFQMKVLDE